MTWRRGLFRLWLAASVCWIVWIGWLAADKWWVSRQIEAGLPPLPPGFSQVCDLRNNRCATELTRSATGSYLIWAFGPSAAALAIGVVGNWVADGFKGAKPNS